MNKREELVELAGDDELLFIDPERFDAAIIGYVERAGDGALVCYNKDKVIAILMEDGMDSDEASEYYYYNIFGAYVGDKTPVFLETV
jgi:hypothetical protein